MRNECFTTPGDFRHCLEASKYVFTPYTPSDPASDPHIHGSVAWQLIHGPLPPHLQTPSVTRPYILEDDPNETALAPAPIVTVNPVTGTATATTIGASAQDLTPLLLLGVLALVVLR